MGLGYREIAGIMRCPVGTVMSRLHRGRGRLREMLPQAAAEAEQARPRPAAQARPRPAAPSTPAA